jgi:hypothetical protein
MSSPDDPAADWANAPPTELTDVPPVPEAAAELAVDPVTAPHDVATLARIEEERSAARVEGRAEGYAVGFVAGQDDALEALRLVFAEAGQLDEVAEQVVAKVRTRLTRI